MTPLQEKRRRAKIDAELDKGNFGGYCGCSEFLKYDWKRFKDWCAGMMLVAIGEGKFNSELGGVIQLSIAWHEYRKARFALLDKYGLKDN